MSVKSLAQGNNDLLLTGFEPMRLAILLIVEEEEAAIKQPYKHGYNAEKKKTIYEMKDSSVTLNKTKTDFCLQKP